MRMNVVMIFFNSLLSNINLWYSSLDRKSDEESDGNSESSRLLSPSEVNKFHSQIYHNSPSNKPTTIQTKRKSIRKNGKTGANLSRSLWITLFFVLSIAVFIGVMAYIYPDGRLASMANNFVQTISAIYESYPKTGLGKNAQPIEGSSQTST